MIKLLTLLISAVLIFIFVVVGLTNYLGPDDLRSCGQTPNIQDGKNCEAVDAIVAISGGDTNARTQEAISLYKSGWAPKLIFSGAALDQASPSNAQQMRQHAINAGISESVLILDDVARDTAENAQKTRELAEKHGIKSIILVTSGYHQRRASISFNQAFDKQSVINHPAPTDKSWGSTWWTTPYGWWLAAGEMVKISVITFKGAN